MAAVGVRGAVAVDHRRLVVELTTGQFLLYRSPSRTVLDATVTAAGIAWPDGTVQPAAEVLAASEPLTGPALADQRLDLGQRNRAPTPQHPTHHVHQVLVGRFDAKPFLVVESIRGGHGDAGGSSAFTLKELLAWPQWRDFFALAGCAWAVPVIEANDPDMAAVHDALAREAHRRTISNLD